MKISRRKFLASVAVGTASAWAKESELTADLAVVGGGSGGFGTALAAARAGLRVVLIEKADCLGGNSVRCGVHCWEPGVGGTAFPFEIYKRLKRIPNAVGVYSHGRHAAWGGETVIDSARRYVDSLQRHVPTDQKFDERFRLEYCHGVVFEPDAMAQTMMRMLHETGRCELLLATAFKAARIDGDGIEHILLSDGRTLKAAFYADATGDGWLCSAVGCTTLCGQESRATFGEPSAPEKASSRVNGVTLIYRVAKKASPCVDPLPSDVPEKCWWCGRFPSAQINQYPNGDLNINMLPTMEGEGFLGTAYQTAYAECQRRVRSHWHNLQSEFEEFRRFEIKWIAPALGVRESRRVRAEYMLTENDVRGGLTSQKHNDIIALADHPSDLHGSHSHGIKELREPYGVPYRCLIPRGCRNLLVACRAAGFSSLAASSCRLSRTMMQLGHAAGIAVALAKELRTDLALVPADRLRARLRELGVQLYHPLPAVLCERLTNEG